MNGYSVALYSDGPGACWVEIMNGTLQEGADIDCKTRSAGVAAASRECQRLGLDSFMEVRTHRIKPTLELSK